VQFPNTCSMGRSDPDYRDLMTDWFSREAIVIRSVFIVEVE
jgi:hypothetical protein